MDEAQAKRRRGRTEKYRRVFGVCVCVSECVAVLRGKLEAGGWQTKVREGREGGE